MLYRVVLMTVFTLAVGGAAAAETAGVTYGPYRFRMGDEHAHTRFAYSLTIVGEYIVAKSCATGTIKNFISPIENCYTIGPVKVDKKGHELAWQDGADSYVLDLKTYFLNMALSGGKFTVKVEPGVRPWLTTPIIIK